LKRFEAICITSVFALLLVLPCAYLAFAPATRTFVSEVVQAHETPDVQNAVIRLRHDAPYWNAAASLYSQALYELGVSPDPRRVVVGRGGWLFLGGNAMEQALGYLTKSAAEAKEWVERIDEYHHVVTQAGASLHIVIAPQKACVYRDKLFAGSPRMARETSLDKILAQTCSLPLLDFRPSLISARETADTYSKLNTHWSVFGAYTAWEAIAESIRVSHPGFLAVTHRHPISVLVNTGVDDLGRMIGVKAPNNWTTPADTSVFPPVTVSTAVAPTPRSAALYSASIHSMPTHVVCDGSTSALSALVIGDSQVESLSRYIHTSFRSTHYIYKPLYQLNEMSLSGKLAELRPDVVILVITERFLAFPLPRLTELQRVPRPGTAGSITANAFEVINVDQGSSIVRLKGWAFANTGAPSENQKVYVLFSTHAVSFALPTSKVSRPDVRVAYGDRMRVVGDAVGFSTTLALTEIPEGVYQLGIMIRDSGADMHVRWMDKTYVRTSTGEFGIAPAP
jgi:hypothetical protein